MINSTVNTVYHSGDGVTTQFAYPFRIRQESDLLVYSSAVLLTTGYTVSGVGNSSGGTVTFNSAPASGSSNVVFQRDTSAVQTSQYPEGNKFPSDDVEANLDQRAVVEQDLRGYITRSIKLHVASANAPVDFKLVANSAERALRVIQFTSNGNAIELGPSSDEIINAAQYAALALEAADTATTAAEQSETAAMVIQAKGDLLVGQSTGAFDNLAVGSNGKVLTANSSATLGVAWESVSSPSDVIHAGHIYGLTCFNDPGDTTNDLGFTAGECASVGNSASRVLLTIGAITKRLDAPWASGNNNGMRSSSVALANTWYHIFAIRVGGTDDIGADTNINAANLIADHSATHYRRIFSVFRTGGTIRAFSHKQRFVWWKDLARDFNGTIASTGTAVTIATPPGCISEAILNVASIGGTQRGFMAYDSSLSILAVPSLLTSAPLAFCAGTYTSPTDSLRVAGRVHVTTSLNSEVVISSMAACDASVVCVGYVEDRGREGLP